MADANKWKLSVMDTWEWNVAEWTGLGLVTVAETALVVPLWEYLVLALFLTTVWLYCILDFHFVDDLFHGFRGEVPRLHYSSTSKLSREVLSKCKILKERYLATPWLSSPHLLTAFLHVNGNPPPVKYHRQLFITPDKGTIALDWVKPPLRDDKNNVDITEENAEHDETPIVIIVPGLTSDSKDPYLKHIAYMSGIKGWRTLVSNHRGLGGVSITSDQFYNAGWTEDLRRIINYVHGKYPKAPIFTIGTSIGANILVKYLGEEGDSTPVGAAAAVCSPWDLLIGDRYISRNSVQKLYNKALTFGLVQYASVHQTVLGRIADWSFISKSKTVRDFDHYCTRHVGKYEESSLDINCILNTTRDNILNWKFEHHIILQTVDAYYRRCSSADFLTRVAVPLLCFSALDDPVCTKEAIPWDEIIANPNVIMAITKHGGHLAFFEGFTARTIWWTRALIEFMAVVIPSDLMHTPQKVSANTRNSEESDVDKGPYLHVSSSGFVAAEDVQLSNSEITGEENSNEEDVVFEGKNHLDKNLQEEDVSTLKELEGNEGSTEEAAVTITFKDSSELLSLQSALVQLLQQLQDLPSATQQYNHGTRISNHDNANSKNLTVRALRDCTLRAIEVPVSPTVTSPLKNCREVATKLALSSRSDSNLKDSKFGSGSLRALSPRATPEKISTEAGVDQPKQKAHAPKAKNRRTFWFLTYVALATTCPWIGSLLFFWWRRKAIGGLGKLWHDLLLYSCRLRSGPSDVQLGHLSQDWLAMHLHLVELQERELPTFNDPQATSSPSRLRTLINKSWVIGSDDVRPGFRGNATHQFSEMLRANPKNLPSDFSCRVYVTQDDRAALLYSSGTTGTSKGVAIIHRHFISAICMTSSLEAFRMPDQAHLMISMILEHILALPVTLYPNIEAMVVDPATDKPMPPTKQGELWIRGPSIMEGATRYLNNPKATSETVDKAGWLHTGDLVLIDRDGYVFVLDGLKELIKYNTHQALVAPAELEALLLSHPFPNKSAGQIPMVYIVRRLGQEFSEDEVMEWVRKKVLPPFP